MRTRKKNGHRAIAICGILVFIMASLQVHADGLTPAEAKDGWLHLVDGTLYGWNQSGLWKAKDDVLTSNITDARHIVSVFPLSDFLLKFEYHVSATPSGAALRIRTDRDADPLEQGYLIPLADAWKDWPAGSIMNRATNSSSAAWTNAWHTMVVEASGNHIKVELDGKVTADIHDDTAHAGHIAFETSRGAVLEVRNLKAKPLNVKQVYDGADLSGWKNVPYQHQGGKGFLGVFGGGPGKPHTAEWSVKDGAVHGEKGPGALQSTTNYDDFLVQFRANSVVEPGKKDVYPALYIRGDAGNLGTGYPLGVGSHAGEIGNFAHPRKPAANGDVLETVIAEGRQICIFLNGELATVYRETRPEAANAKLGARLNGGPLSLEFSQDARALNAQWVAATAIPRETGGLVKVQPRTPAPQVAAAAATTPTPAATTTAQTAQLAAALGLPTQESRAKVASLMSQAIQSSDPHEQMRLYDQVVKIDPSNSAAIQGYKEAQQKADQQQQQVQQQQQQQQAQETSFNEKQQQLETNLASAQASFLGGNLKEADRYLRLSEQVGASNPLVSDLRRRIDAATSLRRRLLFTGGAVGLAALVGSGMLFFRRRRQSRFPILEVVKGLDQGRKYPLDHDIVRIGAVAQDGRQKNDIVIRDIEHLVSRFHCEIVKRDGLFLVKDMNSSNGTVVDGKTIQPGSFVPLRRRGKIDLAGSVVLRLGYERRRKA